ncbi:MAG: erythromycin esterase family protein, partial [Planctomycetota bacterium]|nr:erythromycin esterase family protein [Planctomycetota bacterium]
LSHCIDSYALRERFEYSKNETEKMGQWGSVAMRDEQMAKNFRWLADERYPGQKIMTWAATFHQAHNLKLVEAPRVNYADLRAMGEFLHEWYGDKLFTIGFCAYQGTGGVGARRFELGVPHADSIESLCHAFGRPFLFLPLRKKGPFDAVHFAAPMAYGRGMKGPWPQVLDALFFIDEMTHTRYR